MSIDIELWRLEYNLEEWKYAVRYILTLLDGGEIDKAQQFAEELLLPMKNA